MRAGRLVTLVMILERRGRVTAAQLAAELEVSERTVLRDLEALSGAGVPVFAVRGRNGGFQLLDGARSGLGERSRPRATPPGTPRGRVRISAEGRRTAAVAGLLQPLRPRPGTSSPDGWTEATFRMASFEGAVMDVLALGPDVEALAPPALRTEVARRLHAAAARYPVGS